MSDPTTMLLDEKDLRRDGFREDMAVTLADGQEWQLPRPSFRTRVARTPEGKTELRRSTDFAPGYGELFEAFTAARTEVIPEDATADEASASTDRLVAAQFQIGAALLMANYSLSFDQAANLMAVDLNNPEQVGQLWRICALGSGVHPSRFAAPNPAAA